jgi:phospholipid/cholesterol/gamma-HCH transport system ATP-binding protein
MWLYAAERDGSCGVRENLRLLPKNAHHAILNSPEGTHKYPAHEFGNAGYSPDRDEDEALTASISTQRGR